MTSERPHDAESYDFSAGHVFASGNNAVLIRFEDSQGHKLVAKKAVQDNAQLDREAYMLKLLRDCGLLVPNVYYVDPLLCIMDDIGPARPKTTDFEENAARALAKLHATQIHNMFGLERDTTIGPLCQPNKQHTSWIDFFREERLLAFAQIALDQGHISSKLYTQIDILADKLGCYIDSPSKAVLIHGDAWAGNMLVGENDKAYFIDPACYYADAEIELAFIELMGGTSPHFFDVYYDIHPPKDGFFEVRRDIYNLYPLLVHAILFRSGYVQMVQNIVQKFI